MPAREQRCEESAGNGGHPLREGSSGCGPAVAAAAFDFDEEAGLPPFARLAARPWHALPDRRGQTSPHHRWPELAQMTPMLPSTSTLLESRMHSRDP